mmetsp:Transcript_13022/g.40583  ORF Transcript_13022/g.40583 Transcript_13022/m.40583 type:complete len:266 (-) Transcript_13022:977-1774(-)
MWCPTCTRCSARSRTSATACARATSAAPQAGSSRTWWWLASAARTWGRCSCTRRSRTARTVCRSRGPTCPTWRPSWRPWGARCTSWPTSIPSTWPRRSTGLTRRRRWWWWSPRRSLPPRRCSTRAPCARGSPRGLASRRWPATWSPSVPTSSWCPNSALMSTTPSPSGTGWAAATRCRRRWGCCRSACSTASTTWSASSRARTRWTSTSARRPSRTTCPCSWACSAYTTRPSRAAPRAPSCPTARHWPSSRRTSSRSTWSPTGRA